MAASRNVDITLMTDPAPAGEVIDSYKITYYLLEGSGPVSAPTVLDIPVAAPLVISLIATTADAIRIELQACNVSGCSTKVTLADISLPLAVDPASPPTGVSAVAVKV